MNSDGYFHVVNTYGMIGASMFLNWLEKRYPKTVAFIDAMIVAYWLVAYLHQGKKAKDDELLR